MNYDAKVKWIIESVDAAIKKAAQNNVYITGITYGETMKIDYEKYPEFKGWLVVENENTKYAYLYSERPHDDVIWNPVIDENEINMDGMFTPEELRQLADFMDEWRKK